MIHDLRSWARALGGNVSGSGVICPGPGHSASDRSLSVTPSGAAPNGFLVNSFAGDDPILCLDYVRAKLGIPAFTPTQPRARPTVGHQGPPGYRDSAAPTKPPEPTLNNHALAMAIWHAATNPRGTLVEQYLKSRRLVLPDEAAGETIRFHASCSFGPERFPAMVCLVRNIISNEPQGIHRTALSRDGAAIKRNKKTYRLTLGAAANGAIKIDRDEYITQGICIGEGVETCLAGRQMGLRPVWSAVTTGGISNFPVMAGINGLHVFEENDAKGASAKAVEACGRRWHAAGRTVVVVTPDAGNDLNDELQCRGRRNEDKTICSL